MALSKTQTDALTHIATLGGEATMTKKRPLTDQTIGPLVALGLVTTYTKTVVGVTITKVKLTPDGERVAL